MVGNKVPEGDDAWAILMDLKDIVQLVFSPSFTEESIQYMQTKISDHQQGLQVVFPDFKLRPKHHDVEHYPELKKRFGPLVHLWTMRMKRDYFLSLKEQVDIHGRRSVVLRALLPYLCEDDSKFLKTWDPVKSPEVDVDDVPVGIALITANSTDATVLVPDRVAVIIEGMLCLLLSYHMPAIVKALCSKYISYRRTAHHFLRPSEMTAPPSLTHAALQQQRFLVLFDFDETIINESSDDAVVRALPGQHLPDWLKNSYREGHYNEHMQKVLAYMAEQGVSEASIRSAVEKIPPTPGLLNLFQYLQSHKEDFELAVVSDANMYFIETWLERAGVRHLFCKILTNPASFDATGRLLLLPFHSHSCPCCPDNMCKQVILREYLAGRQKERGGAPFQRVFYIGDGANDICPSLALGPRDTAFPRRGFPMHRLLKEMQESKAAKFKANITPWGSGEDIVDCLKKIKEER
ncbi:hypothetical protein L3Q82_001004 [Scortum barcoo]|uniref:Uncharacterized protein n=1 Tax=Scortum barcoo TaxID=214431 RepID=A0ACB8WB33_9TELE|nr:hypothetical protein L3Q82_001004 [Scortum barcoo]